MFGLALGRMGRVGALTDAQKIAALFANSEPGAWYDPADLSTMFQDAAFAVPVTAVEQPVGGMLDLSGRGNHASMATTTKRPAYSRRYNLLTKTEQFDDVYWVIQNATISAVADAKFGTVNRVSSTGGRTCLIPTATLRTDAAQANSISWVVKAETAQRVLVLAGNSFLGADAQVDAPNINNTYIFDLSAGAFVSAPPSALSAVSLGGGWYEITIRVASGSGLNQYFNGASLTLIDGTSNVMPAGAAVLVRSASCVRSTDSHLPYQRVNTSVDYDADPAKFPGFRRSDDVDDSLACGTGGGGSAGFFFSSAVSPLGSAGTNRTLFSDAGTNTGYIVRLNTSNQLELSAGNGAARTSIATTSTLAVGASDVVQAWDDGVNLNVKIGTGPTASIARPAVVAGTAGYTLGQDNGASSGYFNGRIYGEIYRKDSSPTQAQREAVALYQRQKARLP